MYNQIKKNIEGTGFNSVTDFIVYVLRDIVSSSDKNEEKLTKDELLAIRQRLKTLGYLS